MSLTYSQSRSIDITQKVVSAVSIAGELLVIVTFIANSKFRKPFNRLVFYAIFGNIFCNVATLIGQSAIRIGLGSPLCSFQAFLIQWLMPADTLWIFVMAVNVWLTFLHKWDSAKLKRLEWGYVVFCYGCPLVSAIVLLFIKSEPRGKAYGSAVIWCWISIKWDVLRIAIFYGPVWVVILLTFAIYIRVGYAIWKMSKNIKSSTKSSQQSNHINNTPENEIRRTDEVTIVREDATEEDRHTILHRASRPLFRPHSLHSRVRTTFSGRSKNRGSQGPHSSRTDQATMRYFKCALMFFIALAIVWVPSTINRIWTLIYPNDLIFGLQFAAALVLPCQGLCNACIYFVTSTYAIKCLWRDTMKREGLRTSVAHPNSTHLSVRPGNMTMNSAATVTTLRAGLTVGPTPVAAAAAAAATSATEEHARRVSLESDSSGSSDTSTAAESDASTVAASESDIGSLKSVRTT